MCVYVSLFSLAFVCKRELTGTDLLPLPLGDVAILCGMWQCFKKLQKGDLYHFELCKGFIVGEFFEVLGKGGRLKEFH